VVVRSGCRYSATFNEMEEPDTAQLNAGLLARSSATWEMEFGNENGRGRVAVASFGLGLLGGLALLAPALAPAASPFWVYFFLLVLFHISEYLMTAAFRPDVLSFDNFLLNHSLPYQVMVATCWVEYWVESLLADLHVIAPFKQWGWVSSLGLVICCVGLVARAVGMATASSNFSHTIEQERRPQHMLVTTGIYSVLRHPAYFGFFWWSVGTQVLLANPICFVAYSAASFHFFFERIPYEEQLLVHFFGEAYTQYRERTWIGIPLMSLCIRCLGGESGIRL